MISDPDAIRLAAAVLLQAGVRLIGLDHEDLTTPEEVAEYVKDLQQAPLPLAIADAVRTWKEHGRL